MLFEQVQFESLQKFSITVLNKLGGLIFPSYFAKEIADKYLNSYIYFSSDLYECTNNVFSQ